MTTGIAVFAYDRPDHLQQVLSGLQENDVSHLYLFSDGPATVQEEPKVQKVREVIDNINWCRTTAVKRNENFGLAASLTKGIDRVFRDHDRAIILEDDCVPAPNFISYMKRCLDRYENDERVMNVNGYSPPISIPEDYPYDVYFTYRSSSWGWGTWQRAWESFEQDPFTPKELAEKAPGIKKQTKKAGRDLYPMMEKQVRGHIDSWAVWWSYAIASQDSLCINPVRSLIKNIGHDGSGEHSGNTDRYDRRVFATRENSLIFPEEVFVHEKINERYNWFISGGRKQQIKRQLVRILIHTGLWDTYKRVMN